MKILVTGGSGFIGTHLVRRLIAEGHTVSIFDKRNSDYFSEFVIKGDVRDKDALIESAVGHDAIYHLAAEHADNVSPVSLYYDVNVTGAENVIATADTANIKKIIFTSSVAVYPLNAGEPDEQSQVAPFNEYGRSKLAAEKVFEKWVAQSNDRSLITLRPCVIFGENNRGNVYNLLCQIYRKNFYMIGKGTNKKSMAYVGNFVEFMMKCLNIELGYHLFNYADKPDLTTNAIISIAKNSLGQRTNQNIHVPYHIGMLAGYAFDFIQHVTKKKYPISSIRIKKFCADTTVSAAHVSQTGFVRPYSLEQALKRTIEYEFFLQQ
jgi:nucleoside-diphosphate-sugar epimerase